MDLYPKGGSNEAVYGGIGAWQIVFRHIRFFIPEMGVWMVGFEKRLFSAKPLFIRFIN